MSLLEIRDLTFTYPNRDHPALRNIDLSVSSGDFVLLTGKSGCGKTTLLRQMKKSLIPYGRMEGSVTFRGIPVSSLEDREAAGRIGYVFQDPEDQIVTDRVWHELAFGLENLGCPKDALERRIAEVSNYFGITSWMERETADLSGGEKQLLNLASVLAMEPEVLLLDEPTSQLDPIASARLYDMLHHIHAELGITILMSEHRMESLYAMADQVVRMDKGSIIAKGRPEDLTRSCKEDSPDFPAATRIWAGIRAGKFSGDSGPSPLKEKIHVPPLTIRQGRDFLRALSAENVAGQGMRPESGSAAEKRRESKEALLTAHGLYFSYENTSGELLRGCSLSLLPGQILAIVGGNGSGKTTLLRLLAGLIRPARGKYICFGKRVHTLQDIRRGSDGLVLLPQNPKALFHGITVEEECREMLPLPETKDEADRYQKKVDDLLSTLGLLTLSKVHPYDLSGGEAQRLSIGKLLLLDPALLLMDEPTKGLDPWNRKALGNLLRRLANQGKSILLVTHDLDFAAGFADSVSLLFDGRLTPPEEPRVFFSRNRFYTTSPARMSADTPFSGITVEEVVRKYKAIQGFSEEGGCR